MSVNVGQIAIDYANAFNEVGFTGTVMINTGTDAWDSYSNVRMLFRKVTPDDLLEPVFEHSQILMILTADMPAGVTKLKTRDRVIGSDGREMTIARNDWTRRSAQANSFAIECLVKG